MSVDAPPVDICSQADRLDRKLEQLLLCLAEHLADHDTAVIRPPITPKP